MPENLFLMFLANFIFAVFSFRNTLSFDVSLFKKKTLVKVHMLLIFLCSNLLKKIKWLVANGLNVQFELARMIM